MNRNQRRMMRALGRAGGGATGRANPGRAAANVGELFHEAVRHQHQGELKEAAKLYKEALALWPDHAEASNNLGCVLLAQGKLRQASAQFAHALAVLPQHLDDFASILTILVAVNPALGEGMKRIGAAGPQGLPIATSPEALRFAGDPLLTHVLQSATVRDVDLERLLTCARRDLLSTANSEHRATEDELGFCCALARQCFINEYVFAATPQEEEQLAELLRRVAEELERGARVSPLRLAVIAAYTPLTGLANARALLDRAWPEALSRVIDQQVREPWEEQKLRDSISPLTTIESGASVRVREQYEEHPYPRWVYAAAVASPVTLHAHLRSQFPTANLGPLATTDGIDVLVAGCGTGRHAIEVAQKYENARVLAVDLSLASLAYAKRKTPPFLADRIAYAQADILNLGGIAKTFDLIEASGVLHHLADPMAGWQILLTLLRPGGFMHLGLYSELARRQVVEARGFVEREGFRATSDDIRRCRQLLLSSPFSGIAKMGDFFSISECRDLLFHVQETRLTIPDIKSFITEQLLNFLGFEFAPRLMQQYRSMFGGDPSMRDLDRWHKLEAERPETFAGMYQFWVQKG